MNFSGARVAADSFPIWFCATWINPFSSSGVGMEEPDPGWEWAAVIWGRGGGCRGRAEQGLGWAPCFALSGLTATCCLHQKYWRCSQNRLELAESGQRQPRWQQKLDLTQNMPETSRKPLILYPGIHRMQKTARKPMQRALPASPITGAEPLEPQAIPYPTERSHRPGLGGVREKSI